MREEVAGAEVVAILMVMDSFMTRVAHPPETTIAEEGKLLEVLALCTITVLLARSNQLLIQSRFMCMCFYALMLFVLWLSYSLWNGKNRQLDGFCGKYFEVRTRLFHLKGRGHMFWCLLRNFSVVSQYPIYRMTYYK
jgi:hypothetical protein